MKVSELMSREVRACGIDDNLQRAAQIMWENDCGCVPVLDGDGRVVGIVTDRDICMAGYTQSKPYNEISVTTAMATNVIGISENDLLETAEMLMRDKQVRRLPVLDGAGALRGMLSFNDLARNTQPSGKTSDGLSGDVIARTLAAISQPRLPKSKQIIVDVT